MSTTPQGEGTGPPRDPGWGPAIRNMGRVVFTRGALEDSDAAAIILARSVFVLHSAVLALLLLLVPAITGARSEPVTAWILVGVGVVMGGTGFVWIGIRPLEGASAPQLRSFYLTRFLIQMAFASSTALMGFVAALLFGSTVHYAVSLVVAVPMLVRAAPTAGRIRAEDRAMRDPEQAAPLADAVYRPGVSEDAGREE